MYRDIEGPTKPVEDLNKICHQIPIHLILGKVDDLMYVNLFTSAINFIYIYFSLISQYFARPTHVHKALVDPNSGRQYASIAWVPGIGHLVTHHSLPSIHIISLFC